MSFRQLLNAERSDPRNSWHFAESFKEESVRKEQLRGDFGPFRLHVKQHQAAPVLEALFLFGQQVALSFDWQLAIL